MFCIRIQIIEYNVFISFNYFELSITEPCEDFLSVIAGFIKIIPRVFKVQKVNILIFCLQCDCFREGWNPLCRFLRLEPPDGDFPRLCMIILCNQLRVEFENFLFQIE